LREHTWTRFTASNSLYLKLRLCVPVWWSAMHTVHTSQSLTLPVFQCAWVHWTRKLAAKQSRSKSCVHWTRKLAAKQSRSKLTLPVFQCAWVHWTRKLAAKQSRSKSCALFSVQSIVADGALSQNFRQWSAEASSDRLWLSEARRHWTEWLISCQTDWRWLSRLRWSCVIDIWLVLLYFGWKLSKTHALLSNSMQFWGTNAQSTFHSFTC